MARQFRSDDTEKWTYGFGKGTYDATISGNETMSWDGSTRFHAYGVISGTAGQTSFTKPAGWGHAGFCLLHQTRGIGAGNWELAWVDFSGASAVSDKPLQNTYTTSGASRAQIVTLSNGLTGYHNVTVNGGVTWTVPAWNGSTGGIGAIFASGTVTVTGSIYAAGTGVSGTNLTGGAGIGFYGGNGKGSGTTGTSNCGEGISGGSYATTGANGNGGGGVNIYGTSSSIASGAGGGNGTGGTNGSGQNSSTAGTGGGTSGNNALTLITFGGGGGGGGVDSGNLVQAGSGGGGIVFIIANNLVISGNINLNGGNCGTGATYAGGGGGAGGSCLLKCKTATLGTNIITATGGTGGTGGGVGAWKNGGPGGVGRIHIDYKTSYSGTTNPTIDARQDSTLDYPASSNFFMFFN